jgi:SEC-C motif domain protein
MGILCPCHSGKMYHECCKQYHEGVLAENALKLMRSRYAAYALALVEYIIATTHPDNPAYSSSHNRWKDEILAFSKETKFEGLSIEEFIDGKNFAFVTFKASLKRGSNDVSFTEKSRFEKVNSAWLYRDGTFL